MASTARFDLIDIIDRQPLRAYHYWIAGLCGATILMDGFDTQAIGFVAPALTEQWHIARVALGPVLSSGLLGMLLGALIFGFLGDRWGRKNVLIICTLWFGIGSLITAQATSLNQMLLVRLLTGFGLGGTLPNATALTSEFMPVRRRATGVTMMLVGFSLGGAVGGVVAATLMSHLGWQSVFIVGGLVPCATAILLFRLPESVRFLILKGENVRALCVLKRVAPDIVMEDASRLECAPAGSRSMPVTKLFSDNRTTTTLLIWSLFFLGLIDLYFLNGWLPSMIHDAGIALQQAIVVTTCYHAGGAIGTIAMGFLVDFFQSYRPLAYGYSLGVLAVIAIALLGTSAGFSLVWEALALFAVGFGVTGAHTTAYSLAAECYPTGLRSTGIGWGVGIGRIGSILGPVLGGLLLSSSLGMRRIFLVTAIPPMLAAFAASALCKKSAREKEILKKEVSLSE
jgi:MFS transporter, AAHS family, 4-hydroxybenzoate transporter